MAAHFLAKSEPDVYPWDRLVKERKARWDGVRSFDARNIRYRLSARPLSHEPDMN